jgi:hypothetical protein
LTEGGVKGLEHDTKDLSLIYGKKFFGLEKLNDKFTKAKCYVLALGKNRNRSYFSKEVVDRNYYTLSYVPVVGNLLEDENGKHYLGGHDYKIDKKNMKMRSVCVPFGVAVPSPTPTYEDVIEDDGTKHTYLVADVILWTGRYPELEEAVYSDDVMFNQSMEILYSKSERLKDDTKYTNILDFSFDALCMLNKSDDEKLNVEPCFPSASIVRPFVNYSMVGTFGAILEEMNIELKEFLNNGGNMKKEQEKKVVTFSATYEEKRSALVTLICSSDSCEKDESGNVISTVHHYLIDFDDTNAIVSRVAIDNVKETYDCTNWRISYAIDDESCAASWTGQPIKVVSEWLTEDERNEVRAKREELEARAAEFEKYKASHSTEDSEVEALKEFKAGAEAKERKTAEDALFAKFGGEIGATDEFTALRESAENYSLSELENELYAIAGRFAMAKAEAEPKTDNKAGKANFAKTFIDDSESKADNEPYHAIMEKYLHR